MKRLLIIGCGDVALRTLPLITGVYRVFALIRNPAYGEKLRALGVTPIIGDLDHRHSLRRIAGIAQVVLHFAPPPNAGMRDTRTRNLLSALAQGNLPRQMVYISTSGVYGDCQGAKITETRPTNAQNLRAHRRIDAEQQIRHWAQRHQMTASVLRVPGIYAQDRLPLARLRAADPAILASEDSYSNHIHAEDLARIAVRTLRYGAPNRIYHTNDDDEMKMGDYFDRVADAFDLAHPPRLPRAEVQQAVSLMMWSFMNESRRMSNTRMKRELHVKLRYPTLASALFSKA